MEKLKIYVLDWEDLEQTSEVLMEETVKYDYRSNDIKYVNLAELIDRLNEISSKKEFYELIHELTPAIPGSE